MTIKTDFLENIAGDKSLAVDKIVDGAVKASVNYNGATASVNSSINVSSSVDNGVGTYTFNFTNAFTNGLQSLGATGRYVSSDIPANPSRSIVPKSLAAGNCNLLCLTGTGQALDYELVSANINGDLA